MGESWRARGISRGWGQRDAELILDIKFGGGQFACIRSDFSGEMVPSRD